MCLSSATYTITATQHREAPNVPNPSLPQVCVITAQLYHPAWKSDPTYATAWLIAALHAVYKCAQTWFVDIFFFLVSNFVFSLMHSAHSWFVHTQPQLFVYLGIFLNRTSEGYTAGGKHWVWRWSVGVLSLLFVYRSFRCSLQGREINNGYRQFERERTSPLIEILSGVLT